MVQAVFDSAAIFFICYQPMVKEVSIMHGDTGYAPEMWTASVTAFTALIFVIHFNLFTRMRYITYLHVCSIVLWSILPYIIYMWASNYMSPELSNT